MAHTDGIIAEAARMWNDGYSASMVGAALGLSRNSIVGMAHRNREMFMEKSTSPKPARIQKEMGAVRKPRKRVLVPPTEKRKPLAKGVRRQVETSKLFPVFKVETIPAAVKTEYDAERLLHAVTLEHLGRRQCKWPLNNGGPYLFCAADADGNYCQHHHSRLRRIDP